MMFYNALADPRSRTFLNDLHLLTINDLHIFLARFLESYNLAVSVLASYH